MNRVIVSKENQIGQSVFRYGIHIISARCQNETLKHPDNKVQFKCIKKWVTNNKKCTEWNVGKA